MTEAAFVPGTPLPFERAENFRELGGYPTGDGRQVRRGLFYRSGVLCDIATPADVARFKALGIREVFDFRSSQERAGEPDPAWPGIRRHDVNAMRSSSGEETNFDPAILLKMTPEQLMACAEEVSSQYARLPLDNPAYRELFDTIRAGGLPLLFHCSAGKDRTGVAAALILRMLGVSRELAVQDYMRTNACRAGAIRQMGEAYRALYPGRPEVAAMAETLAGVRQPLIETALDAIDARYPTFEAYLQQQYGIGPEELARIRDACLEPHQEKER